MKAIDLRKLRAPLVAEIERSLQTFCKEHPGMPISTVGLFGNAFYGNASLHLDTAEHSAEHVKKYPYQGEDEHGLFCHNPWDFAHRIDEYSFAGFPDLSEVDPDEPVDFISLDGKKQQADPDDGDEGKNEIVFPFLKEVFHSFEPFSMLSKSEPFRAGVKMYSSDCIEFWLVKGDGGGNKSRSSKTKAVAGQAAPARTTPKAKAKSNSASTRNPKDIQEYHVEVEGVPIGQFYMPSPDWPIADGVRRIVTEPAWDDDAERSVLCWVESKDDDLEVLTWSPETAEERAEADRMYAAIFQPKTKRKEKTKPKPKPKPKSVPKEKAEASKKLLPAIDLPKEIAVDLGKGVKLKMVLIPAGEFLMGSTAAEKGADRDEKPQHQVLITRPFYLGKYLVTQEQWKAVMGNNPSKFKGPKNPVEMVGWEACQQFLQKLNEISGPERGQFQLPAEAQWEYACRAGSKTRYFFGDDESKLGDYAWYKPNSGNKTHPVGTKKPNGWGLYDILGNVSEPCQDWYARGYYKESPSDDPTGPDEGSQLVQRGGAYEFDANSCRSARRSYLPFPGAGYTVGLRVALIPADE